jgi:hypothetical protein
MSDRFDLLIFDESEDDSIKEEKEKRAKANKLKIERAGVCEGCGSKRKLRWVSDDEYYCCYYCYRQGLMIQAETMVPPRRIDDLDEYIFRGEWDDLWKHNK